MNENIIIQKFNIAKNYKPTQKDIEVLKKDINKFIPILQYFIDSQKISDSEKLKSEFCMFMLAIFNDFNTTGYIDSFLYELQALEELIKSPSIIDDLYPEIKNSENKNQICTADKTRTQKIVLRNALDELKKIEIFAERNNITAKTDIKNLEIKSDEPKKVKEIIKLTIEILKQDNMRNKLALVLKAQQPITESFIRENQINSLKSMHDFFQGLGFKESYIALYNITKNKFGFSELEYNNSDFTTVFSEEFLNILPTRDLCFLNTFWSNRFAKECSRLHSAFCAIDSLNLWDEIIAGKSYFNIDNEATLKECFKKSVFLTRLLGESFTLYQNTVTSNEILGNEIEHSKDYTQYYQKISNIIQSKYENYFNQYNLINNNFYENAVFSLPLVNLQMVAYRKKDTTLIPLINYLFDSNYSTNWGIIRNEMRNDRTVDMLLSNKKMLLIAADIEGFDMPFRFHIEKDSLKDIAKLKNPSCLIPEYQGFEDFIIDGKVIPANFVMPILRSHRQSIIENEKNAGPMQNFWEHKRFLMNGKFPKHLTYPVKISKTKTIPARLPIHYSSLITGKRFIKNKNTFEEVGDTDGR